MTIKYIIDGKSVYGVVPLGNDKFVLTSNVFTKKNAALYDNKKDALYDKLIRDLKSGKPLSNYKTSKYYQYYLERLKKDNPEYAI